MTQRTELTQYTVSTKNDLLDISTTQMMLLGSVSDKSQFKIHKKIMSPLKGYST